MLRVSLLPLLAVVCARLTSAGPGDTLYGSWQPDPVSGTPSFVFVGGNSTSPGAIFPTSPDTALHAIGNDRLATLVFADGTLSMRQDEGGPKLLNGFGRNATAYGFRGGYGFISDEYSVLALTAVNGTVGGATNGDVYHHLTSLTLGTGLVRKTLDGVPVAKATLYAGVTQTLVAPFGDDSVLLSLVDVITAGPAAPVPTMAWTEVWSCGDRFELGWGAPGGAYMPEGFQKGWTHNFTRVLDPSGDGRVVGLVDVASISGSSPSPPPASVGDLPTPSQHDPAPRPSFLLCLSCALHGDAGLSGASLASFTTDAAQLFCPPGEADCDGATIDGPARSPATGSIVRGLDNSTARGDWGSVLALQARFPAPPRSHPPVRIGFLYGYLRAEDVEAAGGDVVAAVHLKAAPYLAAGAWATEDFTTGTAWAAYASDLTFASSASGASGANPPSPSPPSPSATIARRVAAAHDPRAHAEALSLTRRRQATGPAALRNPTPVRQGWTSWEGREAQWSSHMLRASLTFDSYYNTHLINQGGNYLYISGQQAAARDPLAHILPLVWGGASSSPYVFETVKMTLLEKRTAPDALGRPAGSLPWGRTAFGLDSSASFNQSDMELAVLWTFSQLALATRNTTLLTDPAALAWNGTFLSVADAAWASFLHLQAVVGTGPHGLLRLLDADQNDGLLTSLGVKMSPLVMAEAETVMAAALGCYVLPLYADVLASLLGQGDRAAQVLSYAQGQAAAVAAAWSTNETTGEGWYRRAWLPGNASDPLTGWRGDPAGDGTMWTEVQAWALFGNVPNNASQAASLVALVDALARKPSPIGALNTPPYVGVDVGVAYGGIWQSGELALIGALGTRGWPDMALDEWRKSSLSAHADAYPQIWFAATNGPDVIASVLAAEPPPQQLSPSPSSPSSPSSAPANSTNVWQGSTRCQWNAPGILEPCNELAFPILNAWSHTSSSYTVPHLIGAEWDAAGLLVRPQITSEPSYAVWTPLVGVTRLAGPTACSFSGHWAPSVEPGATVLVRVALLPADLAACTALRVNGRPAPLVVDRAAGLVVINATAEAARTVVAREEGGEGIMTGGDAVLLAWELT
jgi:hypothetical protein